MKVDFIPPIRDYELGLCVLSARRGGGGAGANVNKSAIMEIFFAHIFIDLASS